MSSIARPKPQSRLVKFYLFLVAVMKETIHESACAEGSMCWWKKYNFFTKRIIRDLTLMSVNVMVLLFDWSAVCVFLIKCFLTSCDNL